MNDAMDKINLTWAVIWSIVFVCCIVGIFWNPAHFFTAGMSAFFAGSFIVEYVKYRKLK